jgi:hypothetical protein
MFTPPEVNHRGLICPYMGEHSFNQSRTRFCGKCTLKSGHWCDKPIGYNPQEKYFGCSVLRKHLESQLANKADIIISGVQSGILGT